MGEIHRSSTDKMLDAALACTCSREPSEENDDFDRRLEKICRIRTADTSETKLWNEYMARALLDEDGSVLTFESCASTALDYGTSDDSQTRCDTETSEGIEAMPIIIEPTQIVFHTIRREETEESQKLDEKLDEKVKTPLMPRLKIKLKEIIRRHNAKAENNRKQFFYTALPKMVLRLRSKVNIQNCSYNELPDNALPVGGCETVDEKSRMPIHSWKTTENKGSDTSGFEVSRIGSNHISIIDRSLLLQEEVTPDVPFDCKLDEPPPLGNPEKRVELKRATSNAISVHIFGTSLLGDHLLMPSIDEDKEERNRYLQSDDCSISISPKPASFVDVLDEEGSRSTISSCTRAGMGSTYEEKTDYGPPQDDLVIEESTSNGDSSHFEIMYKIQAPYKISRNTELPEC